MLRDQWRAADSALAGMAAFEAASAQDPFRAPRSACSRSRRRRRAAGVRRSYGRSVELPRYARTLVPTLEAFSNASPSATIAASGWPTSPTVGGQSWLAHGTFESGLWLGDQARYQALIESERLTLTRNSCGPAIARSRSSRRSLPPVARGQAPRLREDYAAADLAIAAGRTTGSPCPTSTRWPCLSGRARAPSAPVRGGLADQQPCALDADRAGAGRLVRDRRRQRVLAVGGCGRPAGGGVARSRAGARAICPRDRLRASRARVLRGELRRRAHAPDPGRRPPAGAADHRRGRSARRADPRDLRRSGPAGAVPRLGVWDASAGRRAAQAHGRISRFLPH